MDARPEEQLNDAAVLADPVRRALYLHVARHPEVSRDDAARAVRIERSLAAFHLDKLVAAGLLDVSYRRLSGRTGPGAGRPSKLYRRSAREIEVQVPPRRYRLLAGLLADAVESAGGAGAARALAASARGLGEQLGTEARSLAGPRAGRDRLVQSATRILEGAGFEPYREPGGDVRLRNCPFDALAREHRDLVCGMNVEIMDGVLEGLRVKGIEATFEPVAGECCVALRRRAAKR
jgi:predicted ArsR family transcriptional regulator